MSRSYNHAHAHWSRRRCYEKQMLADRAADRARDVDHYAAHEAEARVDTRYDGSAIDAERMLAVVMAAVDPPMTPVVSFFYARPTHGFEIRTPLDAPPLPTRARMVYAMQQLDLAATPIGRLARIRRRRSKPCEAYP